ncbi:hypothetical protein [Mycobacterium sp. SMC-17]|uniref:hypothetical protein n=1 Tax=Mycobacterium sp. SMC-17 TaxID=3381628 RepID=UPI003876C01A
MTGPIDLSGFTGWVPFEQLPTAGVPTEPGVYVVVRPSDDSPKFLDVSPAGHFKGKDPTVAVAQLHALWVPGERVIYIGKANLSADGKRHLRTRLDEFRKFGAGAPIAHSGGRRIWQLTDHTELLVGWRVTADADATKIETKMLADFRSHYGRLPFANMRG